MYIRNKPLAALCKTFIGAFALILEWYLLSQFGMAALRLFPTWVLFIAAIYFLSSALVLALNNKKFSGKSLCPVLDGIIIIAFFLMGGVALASSLYQFYLPSLDSWAVWSISLVLPVLALLDWLLFVEKGRWKVMMPFYGLALPALYVATMIFTAEMLPEATKFLYPLEMFDLRQFGVWPAIHYMVATVVLLLIFGYILYMLDFTMSGKLARHVVLPHLKVVDVDEDGNEIPAEPEKQKPQPQSSEPEIEITAAETIVSETELENTSSSQDDLEKDTDSEKPTELSSADKQAINDLGEVLTEAIQAELSKQTAPADRASEPAEQSEPDIEPDLETETVGSPRVEIAKIVILEDDETEDETEIDTETKTDTRAKANSKSPASPSHPPKPKKAPQPSRPRTQDVVKHHSKSQKPHAAKKSRQKPKRRS